MKGYQRGRKRARYALNFGYGPYTVGAEYEPGDGNSNGQATTFRRAKKVTAGRKGFKLSKLLRSTVNHTEQCLGVQGSDGNWISKHMVSEYGQGGGFVSLTKDLSVGCLPMHIYDLNTFVGTVPDNQVNYPVRVIAGQNTDANARAWYLAYNNRFAPLLGTHVSTPISENIGDKRTVNSTLRWYVNEPRTSNQVDFPGTKIYRKSIVIDYMLYGTKKLATEYELRVIKITDPTMCPDWTSEINDAEDLSYKRQMWQNLIRAWTINPVLKDVEPGPKATKPWFKTVAKKFVRVGEQTSEVDRIASVKGRIYIRLNEINNMAWSMKDFNVEEGQTTYDFIPNVEDQGAFGNNQMEHKPYWTSRYYLMVRALAPIDTGSSGNGTDTGFDGLGGISYDQFCPLGVGSMVGQSSHLDYQPSYDIAIRTHYLTINANS